MGVRFSLDFYGDQQVDRELLRFSERAQDMTPAWESITQRFAGLERTQFSTGGAKSGGWAPLSPRYAKWKAKHYPGQPILVRTGALRKSLTVRPLGVEHLTPDAFRIGSDVGYGRFHQLGAPNLPRRRPVELADYDRSEFVRVIQRYIVRGEVKTIR